MTGPEPLQSEDLREFMHSPDATDAVLDTLELRHPAFRDANNLPDAARVVCDNEDWLAMLEASAPMNAGQVVTFKSMPFSVRQPDLGKGGQPTADIEVQNVTRELMPYLEAATDNPGSIDLTYRQYLASNSAAPQMVLGGLRIKKSRAGLMRVTATAGYEDFINKPMPDMIRTREEYPGLDR
jgi:hypothetical protein